MKLRVLGAHNQESKETRMESHLIDGVLALDAGSLTRALTFEEQKQIKAILLSHRHFDHVKDILPLGIGVWDSEITIDIYAIEDTVNFVKSNLMDGSLFPNFLERPSPDKPTFRLHPVEFYQEVDVLGYSVKFVPVPHAVPAAGIQVSSEESKLFYTGDTGLKVSDSWKYISPDLLLTEVTYGNENEDHAHSVGHLTPKLLGEALTEFEEEHGYLPRVIVSHINPPWEDKVRKEIAELSKHFQTEFIIGEPDAIYTI